MKSKKGNEDAIAVGLVVFLILVGVGVIALFAGFDTVDAGHKAVLVRFGEITGEMNPGMKWTGVFTNAEQFNLKERKMVIKLVGEDSASDKDGQDVFGEVQINYRLRPDKITQAYTQVGRDDALEDILNMQGVVREGFKSAVVKYTAMETLTMLDELKQSTIERITAKFPSEYFVLENVVVANIDFNPAYKQAIEQKKVAEETSKAVENQVKISKFEADKKIEEARGSAESAKLASSAEAFKIKVNAEAEAESIRIKGDAEAGALRAKKLELNAEMNNYEWIQAWKAGGSQVPTWVTADNAGNFMMQVSVPSK